MAGCANVDSRLNSHLANTGKENSLSSHKGRSFIEAKITKEDVMFEDLFSRSGEYIIEVVEPVKLGRYYTV